MRIVDRKAFLAIEGQVLYTKVRKNCHPDEDLHIKVGNATPNFFYNNSLTVARILDQGEGDDLLDKLIAMELDPALSLPVDYGYDGRDGCHDDETKFAIFEKQDIEKLIGRLQNLLGNMQ